MRKKILYTFLVIFLLFFAFLNYIAYNHSYKFTHYANVKEAKLKVTDTSHIGWKTKLHYIIKGVDVPRPKNNVKKWDSYETEIVSTPQGNIEIWTDKHRESRGTVIMFHGYANKKSSLMQRGYEFYSLGYSIVLVDFLGSGGSDGNTTSIGYYEADQVKACFDFIKEKGEKNIYLFGISMGAVAIMKCIKDHHPDVKGIILECPFGYFKTTVKNRFKNFGIPTFPMADLLMLWGSYHTGYWTYDHNPADYAKEINCPTLLLHGEKDHAVSKKEIDDIFKNLNGEKELTIFENTGHDIFGYNTRGQWVNAVQSFMTKTGTHPRLLEIESFYMDETEMH